VPRQREDGAEAGSADDAQSYEYQQRGGRPISLYQYTYHKSSQEAVNRALGHIVPSSTPGSDPTIRKADFGDRPRQNRARGSRAGASGVAPGGVGGFDGVAGGAAHECFGTQGAESRGTGENIMHHLQGTPKPTQDQQQPLQDTSNTRTQ